MQNQTNKSVLAIDYGDKRVGIAIASFVARLASPLTTLDNTENLVNDIKSLIDRENVGLLVVGYPRGLDGQVTEQTTKVDQFIDRLETLGLDIVRQDESLTSVNALTELNKKGNNYTKADVDALAATYILEDYLSISER
ncbi:MAG TPA: Holliday junction resolvase RuvX [Candidatus Saccharimonadales bacterium]|nr:Holliday junction resolvase RuvX [Candidatus Saccharimonadales bacterium]